MSFLQVTGKILAIGPFRKKVPVRSSLYLKPKQEIFYSGVKKAIRIMLQLQLVTAASFMHQALGTRLPKQVQVFQQPALRFV